MDSHCLGTGNGVWNKLLDRSAPGFSIYYRDYWEEGFRALGFKVGLKEKICGKWLE